MLVKFGELTKAFAAATNAATLALDAFGARRDVKMTLMPFTDSGTSCSCRREPPGWLMYESGSNGVYRMREM